MKLTLGLYGLYILLVVIRGNGSKFTQDLTQDMGGFLPWLVVAAVLGGLYEYEPTKKIAGWFIVLVIASFTIKNYGNLKSTFGAIYTNATTGASQPALATNNNAPLQPLPPLSASVSGAQ